MRFLTSAIFASIVTQASAQGLPSTAQSKYPSRAADARVALIDEIELMSAGFDTDTQHQIPDLVLKREMQKQGAELLIDRANVVASANAPDITERVIDDARNEASSHPDEIGGMEQAGSVAVSPQSVGILVVDQEALRRADSGDDVSSGPRRFQPILDDLLREREASLMLARSSVVMGTANIDVTGVAIQRLKGGNVVAAQPGFPVPDTKIMEINRNAILTLSKVGQSIVSQVNDYTNTSEVEFRDEAAALQVRAEQLKKPSENQSADIQTDQTRKFEADRSAFQQKVQTRQAQIKDGVANARSEVEKALAPILLKIMSEHGANLLLDSTAVKHTEIDCDVTTEAVDMLDRQLPTVKVRLVKSLDSVH